MHALNTMRAPESKGELITLTFRKMSFKAGETGFTMSGILEGSVRLVWADSSAQDHYEDIHVGHIFGSGSLVVEHHRCLGTQLR